jgi:hypothetical protein
LHPPGLAARLRDLFLLRGGPQDLPYSLRLTRALVIALVLLDLAYSRLLDIPLPLPRVAVSIGLLLGLPWLLLALRQRRERYLQTLAALTAAELLFTALFMPLALAAIGMPLPDPENPDPAQIALGWLTLLLLGWKLMVNGHIYRHALDWPRFPAMLLVLALFLLQLGVFRLVFGLPVE